MLFSHDVDVDMLTVTWLSCKIFDSIPQGYKVFDGDHDRISGGVAILFKSSIQLFRISDAQCIDSVFCKAYINKVRFVCGFFCRPPSSSVAVLENFWEYLQCHVRTDDHLILAGHFNLLTLIGRAAYRIRRMLMATQCWTSH